MCVEWRGLSSTSAFIVNIYLGTERINEVHVRAGEQMSACSRLEETVDSGLVCGVVASVTAHHVYLYREALP